jgi:hypothetical protein
MRRIEDRSTWIMMGELATVAFGLLVVLCIPLLTSTYESVDVNSGVVRRQVYICGLQIRDTIRVTPLSQEVRRLGISTHETPHWETMYRRVHRRRGSASNYYLALDSAKVLVQYLDPLALPDDSRRKILQATLQYLKNGDVVQIDDETALLAHRLTGHGKPGESGDTMKAPVKAGRE